MADDEEMAARAARARRDARDQLPSRDADTLRGSDDRDELAHGRHLPEEEAPPSRQQEDEAKRRRASGGWATLKQILTGLFVVVIFAFKYLFVGLKYAVVGLKYLLPFLKSIGSMAVSIGLYTVFYGWRFACGFVALLFVHECGHILMARRYGIPVSAPMFIPFMGAYVALHGRPPNAWVDAWIALAGPALGGAACLACLALGQASGAGLWYALAYTGFFMNLINLIPLGIFDGAKVVHAISPWLMVVGLVVSVALCFYLPRLPIMLLVIMALSLPKIWNLLRGKAEFDQEYMSIGGGRRVIVAAAYFGLAAALATGMAFAELGAAPRR
jgi:Zn-dependent protease